MNTDISVTKHSTAPQQTMVVRAGAGTTYQPNPDDVRISARKATYPNSAVERDALDRIDRAVWDKVKVHERYLVDQARGVMKAGTDGVKRASNVNLSIYTDVIVPLRDGAVPSTALAKTYERLRVEAELTKSALRRAQRDAEALIPGVADPYAALVKVWEKYPVLRPALF